MLFAKFQVNWTKNTRHTHANIHHILWSPVALCFSLVFYHIFNFPICSEVTVNCNRIRRMRRDACTNARAAETLAYKWKIVCTIAVVAVRSTYFFFLWFTNLQTEKSLNAIAHSRRQICLRRLPSCTAHKQIIIANMWLHCRNAS